MRRPSTSARPLARVGLAVTGLVASLVAAASVATAAEEPVVVVGSLQDELGCAADWDPGCTDTALAPSGDGRTYTGVFDLPAGTYQLKVAEGGSWAINYGAGGAFDGPDIPLVLLADASVRFDYDDETHLLTIRSGAPAGGTTTGDAALAAESLREPLTQERFYFVMADRFANGDPSNDTGGLAGDRLVTGFDPTDKGFYHGGDLRGIMDRLDYIEGLGTTGIWLTPSFKNRPVQGSGDDVSAGYHGYWITDFTQIDPHLGTNEEMKELIDEAHSRGMKVFFDIITNHTADVIDYREGEYSYRSKADYPYRDAYGNVFDDRDYVGKPFPAMDPETSFPYTPYFRTTEDSTVKVPEWLNDPLMYHNRGDSTFAGESSEYGDFIGLDDLFTERPEVVEGMGEIYKAWVDLGIDGFRIDTVKHVNMEFWQEFSPDVLEHAASVGNEDFFMFGEVFDSNPAYLSTFTTEGELQATLDFGFQSNAVSWAQSRPGTALRDFFHADDWYTDTDSNVYQTPTFLGNHDMGRVAMMLQGASADDAELLARVQLANSLMYLTRGQPITYYGDEQGFIGSGGDKDARQDMFATMTQQYADEKVLAAPSGSMDRYDTTHPLYRHISALSSLRAAHPALADGAQIHRYATDGPGIYAFSRFDKERNREYLVVANNATTEQMATFSTWNVNESFKPLFGTDAKLRSSKDGRVTVRVAPLSAQVYAASSIVDKPSAAPSVTLTAPSDGGTVGGRVEIRATVDTDSFAEATFLYRPVGQSEWEVIGVDDNPPYRVFHDVRGMERGTLLEYRVVARDWRGQVAATSSSAVVGEAPRLGGGGVSGVHPVEQPSAVSVPGTHNTVMGCSGDWQPDCAQAQLAYDERTQLWSRTYPLPAGQYAYKVAINGSWDENYGVGAEPGGGNIPYTTDGTPVTFYYDHATKYVMSTAQGPIISAPGSFQSELGCEGDWDAGCMNPWLQDIDDDGVYTWSGFVPAGGYEFKVVHGLSWSVNYGAGGVFDGPNVGVSVPDGHILTIAYDIATHQITATTSVAAEEPTGLDLGEERALWVDSSTIAWPEAALPESVDGFSWRLHWGPEGSLSVDAEAVTGGSSALLTRGGSFTAAQLSAMPELVDYVPLVVDKKTARDAASIAAGQDAVAMYDELGRLVDATGIDGSTLNTGPGKGKGKG
jgi:glycosidase